MSTAQNGKPPANGGSNRRLRIDDLGSIVARRLSSARAAVVFAQGHSGRRFVLVAGVVLLVIWGVLSLTFRDWKARYRQRAAYGAAQVVPVIDQFMTITPPDVDADAWRDAVHQTRSMVATVIGSNLLDIAEMDRLRAELDGCATRAKAEPASACLELAYIWNTLADRAEFLFQDSRSPSADRHPRPKILPPRPPRKRK